MATTTFKVHLLPVMTPKELSDIIESHGNEIVVDVYKSSTEPIQVEYKGQRYILALPEQHEDHDSN